MTAPLPPTDGPMGEGSPAEKLSGDLQGGLAPDIQADLPDLAGIAEQAKAAGDAWQAGAAAWADSPQGAGADGWTLSGDQPAGADGVWNSDMSFPHQGP
jgi:hypothetical protein